ncbi:MAG: type II toxin-antitoxin system VapC family toxin [Synergistaceae bacterium]|nr:type II toxin-antitoxin system VapC family toxin [Synergistaceae bacterium]
MGKALLTIFLDKDEKRNLMLKIYIDNCCYNRPFDNSSDNSVQMEAAAKLFIQSLIKYGDISLVSSFILYSEIIDNPYEYKKDAILRFIDEYAKQYIGSESVSEALTVAGEIMKSGVKAPDAAHVVCAILAGCDYFITTDKRLLKYKTNRIKLLGPIEFIGIW